VSRKNNMKTETKLQNIQRGIAKVLVGGTTMAFRGKVSDGTTLGPLAAAALSPFEGVHTQKAGYSQAMDTRDSQDPATQQFIEDFRLGAESTWGIGSAECQEFGFLPRKEPAPLTADQKALRTARLRATRKARKTLGSRQKRAVKGVVDPGPGTQGNGGAAATNK